MSPRGIGEGAGIVHDGLMVFCPACHAVVIVHDGGTVTVDMGQPSGCCWLWARAVAGRLLAGQPRRAAAVDRALSPLTGEPSRRPAPGDAVRCPRGGSRIVESVDAVAGTMTDGETVWSWVPADDGTHERVGRGSWWAGSRRDRATLLPEPPSWLVRRTARLAEAA